MYSVQCRELLQRDKYQKFSKNWLECVEVKWAVSQRSWQAHIIIELQQSLLRPQCCSVEIWTKLSFLWALKQHLITLCCTTQPFNFVTVIIKYSLTESTDAWLANALWVWTVSSSPSGFLLWGPLAPFSDETEDARTGLAISWCGLRLATSSWVASTDWSLDLSSPLTTPIAVELDEASDCFPSAMFSMNLVMFWMKSSWSADWRWPALICTWEKKAK